MRLLCITLLILSQAAAPMAQAGAWLRESGTGFVSLSFGATQFSETTNAAYIEYGLSDATTIGLDISSFCSCAAHSAPPAEPAACLMRSELAGCGAMKCSVPR